MLSWNSRGLGHPSKIASLKDLIQSEKPEIVLIQETKQDQSEINRVISQQKRYSGCASEARGASGGILTIEKEACWNTLETNIEEDQDINLILAGDLNLVLHANEKRGGNFSADPFRNRLEHIIQEQDLVDIKPKNRRYTWSNRRLGAENIMERLDRFLINIAYLSSFSTGQSNILNNSTSDHYPITLTLHRHCQLGPLPFKYCSL
eukprot:PITA_30010